MFVRKSYVLAAPLRADAIAGDGAAPAPEEIILPAGSLVTLVRRAAKPGMVEVQCGDRRYALLLIDLTTRAALTTNDQTAGTDPMRDVANQREFRSRGH
jgi:hypothetical protein